MQLECTITGELKLRAAIFDGYGFRLPGDCLALTKDRRLISAGLFHDTRAVIGQLLHFYYTGLFPKLFI